MARDFFVAYLSRQSQRTVSERRADREKEKERNTERERERERGRERLLLLAAGNSRTGLIYAPRYQHE
jgi:hypothetical protein